MIEDIEQGTLEWLALKRGNAGASHMADVMMKPTQAGYRNYRAQLVVERITGQTEVSYCNGDMQRGIDLEPDARDCYEFLTDFIVEQVAWVPHPAISCSGCSPDGLVGADGLIEIKCPKQATHLDTLLADSIDTKYLLQMQWQMACTGRQWCDFVSYHPGFPEKIKLKIIRIHRDEKKIAELEKAVIAFLADVETYEKECRERME